MIPDKGLSKNILMSQTGSCLEFIDQSEPSDFKTKYGYFKL